MSALIKGYVGNLYYSLKIVFYTFNQTLELHVEALWKL